jgi:aminoglycoside phosphotransferase family enzyme
MAEGQFPDDTVKSQLVETHISWVILGNRFVFKIKKPVTYSFLDFSTPEKRKYYCEREILLNRRLTRNIYLDVQPVREVSGRFFIGGEGGTIIDYAVWMQKIDPGKQMDLLLRECKVSPEDIRRLADKIASFHRSAEIIHPAGLLDVQEKFNDLEGQKDFLEERLHAESRRLIEEAIQVSGTFIKKHKPLLAARAAAGFFRDGHGDLHTRNIFLLPEPQPFDCIEFNDDYRRIDVLNEVAFFCMDLDAFGRQDLSDLFINHYNRFFATMKSEADQLLFMYYKSYRAGIRAKVDSLRAQSAENDAAGKGYLAETDKYLKLMGHYIMRLAG